VLQKTIATQFKYFLAYDLSAFHGVDTFLVGRDPKGKIAMRVRRIDLLVVAEERDLYEERRPRPREIR